LDREKRTNGTELKKTKYSKGAQYGSSESASLNAFSGWNVGSESLVSTGGGAAGNYFQSF
jgi:hypothetical protein